MIFVVLMILMIIISQHVRADAPVVYVQFARSLRPGDYLVKAMGESKKHANVVLLAGEGMVVPIPGVSFYPMRDPPLLSEFRKVYRPWGLLEPWERQNTERFFYLYEWMKSHSYEQVWYLDSDVVLIGDPPRKLPEDCDAIVDLHNGGADMRFASMFWGVWAGSAMLTRELLKDFLEFAVKMYSPPYFSFLEQKHKTAPYVCDMTLWYFYVSASSPELAEKWLVPVQNLPPTSKKWRYCDSDTRFRFDHGRGHLLADPAKKSNLISIHFMGDSKNELAPFVEALSLSRKAKAP